VNLPNHSSHIKKSKIVIHQSSMNLPLPKGGALPPGALAKGM
jgi:hypothetical protein